MYVERKKMNPTDGKDPLPQLDEFYFTTTEQKLWKIADVLFRIS
jgi:hypothetical protein